MRFGLSETAIQNMRDVFARHPQVERVILYGSRAKGNYKNGSDIDLTLQGDGLTLRALYRVMDDLDELLLPHSIDLSIMAHIDDPAVLDHIRRVGVVFYAKPAQLKDTPEQAPSNPQQMR
ncbi:MAG TPA: nucleotidyltransferase domain-containing protein [Thermoflexales bacterium]|nr:nucleotidyltransferase domain-containing protein [Thermoflexales bacterium]HQW36151.1 nucleotidyltransferase domain-containing protein [Thermoflexales bacterium]HQX75042.1 nucleotidyltransferase domain-containing protein [Thermoflexales bacterium]HQZ21956.1 nucleotidyltransferase domain-containing protein [Thermoflexales bacterium]HQZ99950.1 nucleotidyltransferase domain-containing protein [Thermoflexales bacterium]